MAARSRSVLASANVNGGWVGKGWFGPPRHRHNVTLGAVRGGRVTKRRSQRHNVTRDRPRASACHETPLPAAQRDKPPASPAECHEMPVGLAVSPNPTPTQPPLKFAGRAAGAGALEPAPRLRQRDAAMLPARHGHDAPITVHFTPRAATGRSVGEKRTCRAPSLTSLAFARACADSSRSRAPSVTERARAAAKWRPA
jgi:hypothetical protein